MASVFSYSKLLIGYVITLKLKKIIENNLPPKALPLPWTKTSESSSNPWIITMDEKLDHARQYVAPWEAKSICRIPKFLRDVNQTAYTPQMVSIGPYHRKNPLLSEMDIHKWRALYTVLSRTGHNVQLYLDVVKSLEKRVRKCYELDDIPPFDEFVELLVMDSIFVLEIFRGVKEGFQTLRCTSKDLIFNNRGGIILSLQRDMIMLENQLPLFLLDHIFSLQCGHNPPRSGLVVPLALHFFENLRPTNDPLPSVLPFDPFYNSEMCKSIHCLDVFHRSLLQRYDKPSHPGIITRHTLYLFNKLSNDIGKIIHNYHDIYRNFLNFLIPTSSEIASQHSNDNHSSQTENHRIRFIHCASELHDAGIKFRCRETNRFWDIQFKDGILKIPHIFIVGGTKTLLLNLIAFEQCHLEGSNDITSYMVFMDCLINSEVDVRYLHDQGIIEHFLENDREVANLFNGLCRGAMIDFGDSYLLELTDQVNSYCKIRWNAWLATFKHKYFSNPWTLFSLLAAAVLLLLTFVQTFYAIYDLQAQLAKFVLK